jgi:precorrin-6A synthase
MLYVIGIGAGDPRQVTVQAVEAIRQVDTFFVIGKGETKRELTEVRAAILAGHADPEHRVVSIADPPRERTVEGAADYREVVEDWHRRRAELLAEAFDATGGSAASWSGVIPRSTTALCGWCSECWRRERDSSMW